MAEFQSIDEYISQFPEEKQLILYLYYIIVYNTFPRMFTGEKC